MKKILLTIFAIGALVSCDTIDEADRLGEPIRVEIKKNVLVEDFTGQNCVNCPKAADLLHKLFDTSMGQHIVAVSIHGGSLGLNVKTPQGLATDQGEEYNTHWGLKSWPSGMVDRGSYDANGKFTQGITCDFGTWTSAISKQMKKDLLVNIDLTTAYDADQRALTVEPAVTLTEGSTANLADCRLTVWLTESHVEGLQLLPDGSRNMKYDHNHVLRECLSAPYGDELTEGASYSYTIPATYGRNKWAVNPDNMAVVAFVTDKTGEVLQVVDVPVVK